MLHSPQQEQNKDITNDTLTNQEPTHTHSRTLTQLTLTPLNKPLTKIEDTLYSYHMQGKIFSGSTEGALMVKVFCDR